MKIRTTLQNAMEANPTVYHKVSTGTTTTINFPFGPNEKLIVLVDQIFKHIRGYAQSIQVPLPFQILTQELCEVKTVILIGV